MQKDRFKILLVVGTRPNFIKITQFDRCIAPYSDRLDLKLVHTSQHYDVQMSDIFFQQLQIRQPDYFLNIPPQNQVKQIGAIMSALTDVCLEYKPDLVLVVGDVNSTFAAAFAAHRNGLKVAHIESGLRSGDRDMPEEINRILTDEICDYFYITEPSGEANLKHQKQANQLIYVGNTMIDTLVAFETQINSSDILKKLGIENTNFALVTIHRPSNVDTEDALAFTIEVLESVSERLLVVFPIHPRTMNKLNQLGWRDRLAQNKNILFVEPLDYFAFQKLVKNCQFVLTDSGGIQEETTYRRVPCLTLRKNTERPVTCDIGSNTLLPFEKNAILSEIHKILNGSYKIGNIPHLWDGKATERIVRHILSLSENKT